MVQSMTGFGKSITELPTKKISIEVRSLNSKNTDFNVKMPSLYREKENQIRTMLRNKLSRGKVDFNLYIETQEKETSYTINREVFKDYYRQLNDIAHELNEEKPDILAVVSRFPEILKPEKESLDEKEWEKIKETAENAVEDLISYRSDEGKSIEKDFHLRISNIQKLLKEIEKHEKTRTDKMRERIYSNLEENIDRDKIDNDRFEQEVIYWLEKLDVTEEKVRLSSHCEYFLEIMESEGAKGKKLGFISQEIGREVNTLGSKANHAEFQKLVVQMKDELEKIKEQVLNVL